MVLSKVGITANDLWLSIPNHYQKTSLDEFVIMPNHIHGIIIIQKSDVNLRNEDIRSLQTKCWHGAKSGSLSSIVRGFKIGVTNRCRQNGIENFSWQKSFYDHIIRNDKSFNDIRDYIRNNPLKWEIDKNNPENLWI